MKITSEHIKLLKAIKNECSEHEDCQSCKFFEDESNSLCMLDGLSQIDGIPGEWDLKESIENE
ncbi:hypothetical protein [Clostridium sp.]|uniref:hypothetical protein n=1 Tax=Clostridium sp. TaxID=1506 RepID=UPI00346470BF